MHETLSNFGSLLKLPFLMIYTGYLFSLYKIYHWMLKHGKVLYIKRNRT